MIAGARSPAAGRLAPWPGIALVALGQTLALLAIVAGRMLHLASGTEVVLDVVPVDPRSLFRGDYVVLSTEAHTIRRALLVEPPKGTIVAGDIYVVLRREDGTGVWHPKAASLDRPQASGPDEVAMKGRIIEAVASRPLRVAYGIESYFVPEGKGRGIESEIGSKRVSVRVAIDRNGNPAIKALLVDGRPVHAESLF